jgi:septal ring factor EnvC (AmiA/AmiB activator)
MNHMRRKLLLYSIFFLLTNGSIMGQVPSVGKPLTKADILVFNKSEAEYQQVQTELQQLEQQKNQLLTMMNAFNEQQKKVISRLQKLEASYNALGAAPADTSNPKSSVNATKELQETNFSFNLQYLQLQSQMQHENRSYTAISNIMKTKHDTVKNSISNIR